jgi:hypothetical protein
MPRSKEPGSLDDESSELRRWGITIRRPRSPEPTEDQPDYAKRKTPPRRILPLLGISEGRNEQAEDMDELLDYLLLTERRRQILFCIETDPHKAVLWERISRPDFRTGLAAMWRPILATPVGEKAALYVEARRRAPGLRDKQVYQPRPGETRGRPSKLTSEWQKNRHVYFRTLLDLWKAGESPGMIEQRRRDMLLAIHDKYDKRRTCHQCGERLPNTWPRKECSPRCTQQAFLARRKKK